MTNPTDEQIKIDYLVDRISRFRYVIGVMLFVCLMLGVGMIYVASDNRMLRYEINKGFTSIEASHKDIYENHKAIRDNHDKIVKKLKKLTNGG